MQSDSLVAHIVDGNEHSVNILPGIALVGSGWLGFSLSDPHDCHVFLLYDADDAVLIDAGCGLGNDVILREIVASGVDPQQVSRILITHAHPDHCAGASLLAAELNSDVWGSEYTARVLEQADEQASGLTAAKRYGLYPDSVHILPTVVRRWDESATFRVGNISVTAIPTPGHAAGHVSYLADLHARRILFSGDLIFTEGRVALQATPDFDMQEMAESLRTVAALRPDVLLPGHGTFALQHAGHHLQVAISAFEEERLPPMLQP